MAAGPAVLERLGHALTRAAFRPTVLPWGTGITRAEVGDGLWNCAALPIPGDDGACWIAHRHRCPPTTGCAHVTTIRIARARRPAPGQAGPWEVEALLFDLPVDRSVRCSDRTYSALDWLGPEDPRLLLRDDQLVVVYNDLQVSRERALVRRIHVARFKETTPYRLAGLRTSVLGTPRTQRLEKNWSPLPPTGDGLLRFVYSVNPHTVLTYSPEDLSRPVAEHTTYPALMRTPMGALRGGTNAVPWGTDGSGRPVLLAFVHVTTVWRWYLTVAYTFLAGSPFTVLCATPPLKLTPRRVEFAQSLFPDPATGSHVLVWGEDNRRSHAITIPDRVLHTLLVPVG